MSDQDRARDLFFSGLACLENRDFQNAEWVFAETLKLVPRSVPTLNNLAIAQYEQGKIAEAAQTVTRVLEIDQKNIDAYMMLSTCQKDQQRYDAVLKSCQTIIAIDPTIAETHCNLGYALIKTERYQEAISSFDRAIALQPQFADAHLNRGNALNSLLRFEEAFAAYDQALVLNPNLAEAWLGRGNTLNELRRHDEAFAAYDNALALRADLVGAWVGRGNVFSELKRYDEAFTAYDKALALKPNLAEAWLGHGNVFSDLKRYKEAFTAYDKALALKSDLAEAWLGRGNAFSELKRYDEALTAYEKALDIKPELAEAWLGRGNVFVDLRRYDLALSSFDRALVIRPDFIDAAGARLYAKMNLCNWLNIGAECKRLMTSITTTHKSTTPLLFINISSSSRDLLTYAQLWTARKFPAVHHPLCRGNTYKHEKIRIAYVSSDFREHAISFLVAGMIESHDRSLFEVAAISTGPDDASEMRKRLERSFDTFMDASALSDEDVARWVREKEIDLLIDLNGYTAGSRVGVFAQRPAPIQVNYLGYPGTLGAKYIDYIVADPHVIPQSQMEFYTERVAYLPHCYQANDRKRIIGDRKFSRAELGLPEARFVFCCFNNNFKILPDLFDSWMVMLRAVDGSVLWLPEIDKIATRNLRTEAKARDIDPERLVFAKRLPAYADHLARYRAADLFLDTLPYNAHTTASDALWAGLPVLARTGETFAGRVTTSLLNAIGLPELVTHTREEYESLAMELATHATKLVLIKEKLARNRLTTPLFDTELFTCHIESAYKKMHERYQAGLAPDHIHVPP